MKTYWWLVRRELWENRAVWIIPTSIAALLVLGSLFGRTELVGLSSPAQVRVLASVLLFAFGVVFFLVMSIYSTWYLMDCLYADRRDRSILFWKSLPITDTATVLAKLATGLIVIPWVYFAAADITTLLMAFILSIRLSSLLGSSLWHADSWLQLQVLWFYLIVTAGIWYLPVAAWLMLISAWAKRAVMLWSILPPLALVWAEHWFLGSDRLLRWFDERLTGYLAIAFHGHNDPSAWVTQAFGDDKVIAPGSLWAVLDPAGFFSTPETWIGAALGAALIAGTIQLRLRRTEL
jgi:ABC-2 type transport system permease protein